MFAYVFALVLFARSTAAATQPPVARFLIHPVCSTPNESLNCNNCAVHPQCAWNLVSMQCEGIDTCQGTCVTGGMFGPTCFDSPPIGCEANSGCLSCTANPACSWNSAWNKCEPQATCPPAWPHCLLTCTAPPPGTNPYGGSDPCAAVATDCVTCASAPFCVWNKIGQYCSHQNACWGGSAFCVTQPGYC